MTGAVENCGENSQTSHILSTSSDGHAGFPYFPQLAEYSKPFAIIGESWFLNIFTLSTTTKFFKRVLFFYIGTVHNQAYAEAVEAR